MSQNRADDPKGHRKHDDKGLSIGAEHGGDNDEHPEYGQGETYKQTAEGFPHFFLLSL